MNSPISVSKVNKAPAGITFPYRSVIGPTEILEEETPSAGISSRADPIEKLAGSDPTTSEEKFILKIKDPFLISKIADFYKTCSSISVVGGVFPPRF